MEFATKSATATYYPNLVHVITFSSVSRTELTS